MFGVQTLSVYRQTIPEEGFDNQGVFTGLDVVRPSNMRKMFPRESSMHFFTSLDLRSIVIKLAFILVWICTAPVAFFFVKGGEGGNKSSGERDLFSVILTAHR